MLIRSFSVFILVVLFSLSSLADNFWKDLTKDILNPKPSVSNVKVASDVSDGEAVNEAVEFPSDTEKIHVWFNLSGMNADTSIDTVWYFMQNQKMKEVGRTSYKVKAFDTWGSVHMLKPDIGWLPGDYIVELRLNKEVLSKISFAIIGGNRKPSNQIDYGLDEGNVVEEIQESPDTSVKKKTGAKPAAGQARGTAADAEFIKQQVGASIHNEQTKLSQYKYKLNKEICTRVGAKGCPKCGFDNITRNVDFTNFTITCPACGKYSLSVAKLKNDDGITYQEALQQKLQELDARILKYKEWGNSELKKKNLPPAWDLGGAAAEKDDGVTVEEVQDENLPPVSTKKKPAQAKPQPQAEDFSF